MPPRSKSPTPRSAAKRSQSPAPPKSQRKPSTAKKERPAAADEPKGLQGDWAAIGLLLVLYTLQGVPLGLAGSIPFLMQEKKVSMVDQSLFSLAKYPFSLKLLWAPLVDSIYIASFGRRKTWIVPAQLAIGALLLWAPFHLDTWLGEGVEDATVDVRSLTTLFFVFYFLAATQDIAVDGLALTVLSPRNRELGATCNSIGQSVGAHVAYTGFLVLYSKGIVTLGGFMFFWGVAFLLSTIWVALSKGDEHAPLDGSVRSILSSAYAEMLTVLKLPSVRSMALVLLTAKAALGVFDEVSPLKLGEEGFPKEHLAMIASLMFPVMLLSQLYVSGKYFGGSESKPLQLWMSCYPYRLVLGAASAVVVVLVGSFKGDLPMWLYAIVIVASTFGTAFSGAMFVGQMAFYNRVSDPAIGGTYMTMLNTISNLGSAWPATFALYLVGQTTITRCVPLECVDLFPGASKVRNILTGRPEGDCGCVETTIVDGYLITCGVSLVMGIAWYLFMSKRVAGLQALPLSAWRIPKQ